MGRVTHYDTVQMLTYLHSYRENVAKYYVTVTAGQTHTINLLGIAAGKSAVVSWGDGLSNEYTGKATRTHVYASAGTYEVKIYTPENVTEFAATSNISSLNTADFAGMINMKTFELVTTSNVTFDTTVLPDWTLNKLTLNNVTVAGVIRSEDMTKWGITQLYFGSILGGVTGSIETACFASNNMSIMVNLSNPIPSVVSENSIRNWPKLNTLSFNHMTTQDVDLILLEAYQINRTVTGGKIDLLYHNAAPSGTFQAATSCPVTSATPGREIAYELLNDTCGKGFNKWATVSIK